MTETKPTVAELIEKLKQFDQQAEVFAFDYDFFDIDINEIEQVERNGKNCVRFNVNYI